jgi:hypothetical protein
MRNENDFPALTAIGLSDFLGITGKNIKKRSLGILGYRMRQLWRKQHRKYVTTIKSKLQFWLVGCRVKTL